MSQAVSHATKQKGEEELYEIEGLYSQRRLDRGVEGMTYFRQGQLPLGEGRRSYQADDLTRTDQEIPD